MSHRYRLLLHWSAESKLRSIYTRNRGNVGGLWSVMKKRSPFLPEEGWRWSFVLTTMLPVHGCSLILLGALGEDRRIDRRKLLAETCRRWAGGSAKRFGQRGWAWREFVCCSWAGKPRRAELGWLLVIGRRGPPPHHDQGEFGAGGLYFTNTKGNIVTFQWLFISAL